MKKWLPLLLIFALAAPVYAARTENAFFVVPLLLFMLLSVIARETGRRWLHAILLATGAAVCIPFPGAVLLAPCLFAATVTEKDPLYSFLYFFLILYVAIRSPGTDLVVLCLLFLLALLFRIGTDRLHRERQRYYLLYNDMQETRLRLERALAASTKNREQEVELALLTERNRLTRDMHDGLGHTLSRTILQIGALEATRKDNTDALKGVRESLEGAMLELRTIVHNLKTENFDLKKEIDELIRGYAVGTVSLTYTMQTPLTLDAMYSILAILKEGLSNSARHSDGDFVQIKILETKERIFLIISDNGSAPVIRNFGIGLGSIEERARSMGGQAEFSTDDGFTIRVRIPKEAVHAHHTD